MKSNRQVVLDFFARHGKSPLPGGDAALDVRYLDTGIIDLLESSPSSRSLKQS